ncbi:MAG: hypothetical protein HOV80_03510 [Polyangiaceae bacterium]|nr:hypothetical protein [Polyangiaceae bacterium]
MLSKTTLYACTSCSLHVHPRDLRCPHCNAPMRTAQGGIAQTRTAMAMGLSFLALTSTATACSKVDDQTTGGGGSGGEGPAATTSSTGATSSTTATTGPSTGTQPVTGSSATAMYGIPTCDTIGICEGDGVSPDSGCFECVVIGGSGGKPPDSGSCKAPYDACFGPAGDCVGGEPQCCTLDACIDTCLASDVEYWACVCGSANEASCVIADAPPGTCFGDNPIGAEMTFGPQGWATCVGDVCITSCEI